MRAVFASAVTFLALLSAGLYLTLPGTQSEVPVLYWITQDDDNKRAIARTFEQWLRDQGLPPVELLIDNTNADATKKLVQGVSGVGADIFDLYNFEVDLFPATGMLLDVTEQAREWGFSPKATYPAMVDDLLVNGRQYIFPRNTSAALYWVNLKTFRELGLPPPPPHWTPDEFEELGKRFVAAANPPGTRQRAYFADGVSREVLRRDLGLGIFNETGTVCTLADPRNVAVLERVRRWMVDDRILPTEEDKLAMASDLSQGYSMFAQFDYGRYGMVYTGHWAFIMLRPRGEFELAAVPPPVTAFANTEIGSGAIGIYRGSRHPELAVRFLQFLTSEPFNRLIVQQADALPPVPRFAQSEEFLRPVGRESEWPVHAAFSEAQLTTGLLACRSPFVLRSVVFRVEKETFESVVAGRLTPEQGARQMAERLNAEIALGAQRDERRRARFAELSALQAKIETARAAGERVPAEWILSPFHRAYYRAQGWLLEEGEGTP